MKKFFNVLLVTFLLLIIVGGVGYIGYSYLFVDYSGMNMANTQDTQTDTSGSQDTMSGMQMGSGSQSTQSESGSQPPAVSNGQQSADNSIALNQTTVIFKNKETLNTAVKGLDESLGYLTLDPYSNDQSARMGKSDSTETQTNSQSSENTTINIYPQNNNTVNVIPPENAGQAVQPNNPVMQDMGTVYDAAKMEQLHKGLYNLAVGKALLEQLDNDLTSQAEYANIKVTDPVSYYSAQYNLTQQNKMKLNSAMSYINSAAELVNINPYISAQGLVYDKDRMNQIHQSVFKLAESVVALNLLNDDLTKQSINLVGLSQNYMMNANTNAQMNHSAISTGLFGGIFENVSMQSIVNIILILFVAGLIFGIFGYILSLLKGPKKSRETGKPHEELI